LRKKSSVIALLSKTPRKQAPLNIYLRVLTIRIHPTSQAFMRVSGVLQGRLGTSSLSTAATCTSATFLVGGCLCGRLSLWEAVSVGGCLCGGLSMWGAVSVGGCLCGRPPLRPNACTGSDPHPRAVTRSHKHNKLNIKQRAQFADIPMQ
jgi:hypothetical protein